MIRLSPGAEHYTRLLPQMADYARRIEASGFPGIWVGHSLGRGRPTLDPLVALAALATATERVELGISVLQVPLRQPIELAHNVQSVQALSGGRLRLGVGSGSTQGGFRSSSATTTPSAPHSDAIAGHHAPDLARRGSQWRWRIDHVARMRRRPADPAGRMAQSTLDHLCRAPVPGLDSLRPLQQLG